MRTDSATLQAAIDCLRDLIERPKRTDDAAAIRAVLNGLDFYKSTAAHNASELLREQAYSAALASQIAPNRLPTRENIAAAAELTRDNEHEERNAA